MSAMTDASAVAAITLPAAIVAAYTAARAPFSVTLIPDRSLLLHRAYELIDSNTDLLRPLVQQFLRRRDGLKQYVVGDWTFSLLHVLIELEKLLAAQPGNATLSVLLLSPSTLQSGAISHLHNMPARAAAAPPQPAPLMLPTGSTKLRVLFCSTWARVVTAAAGLDVRALYIPGRDTMLGGTGSYAVLHDVVLPSMLSCFRLSRAELFPPHSWEQMFEHKDATYALFGEEFMLPSLWVDLPSLQAVPAVVTQLLQGRADGPWMVKGSWSWGSLTAHKIEVRGGRCDLLASILASLFHDHHQRRVCIQQYEPDLHDREVRVFLVADRSCASGWRQVVSVITRFTSKDGRELHQSACSCEMQQPTHGISMAVAGLIDRLLVAHRQRFLQAAGLGIPMLRVDCGQTPATGRCFVNELGCMDQVLFSGVHSQDIAHVQGKSYAEQLMQLVRKAP